MSTTRTPGQNRIEVIDVLRGFALAGILYAHMVIWYTGAALPQDIYFEYDTTADYVALAVFGAFVFGKFFSVFSFLFGLGFFLLFRKSRSRSGFIKVYVWRLFLLLLIGIGHHALWRGDILAIYAVLGIFLLLFARLPNKIILPLSVVFILNIPTHLYELFKTEEVSAEMTLPMAAEAEAYYELVQNEDFQTVIKENWESSPAKIKYQIESGRLLMTFGYFLFGFYAGRKDLFTDSRKNFSKFRRWNEASKRAVLGLLAVGLTAYLLDLVSLPKIEVVPEFKWLASFLFSIYNGCLTIFYITGISLLFRMKFFQKFLRPLGDMGRMALTNYLLQTFFGLLLFYDFGFGFFDKTSPAVNVLLGVGIFYLQLKFSQVWLKYFRQGPVEWLWRSLTYFKIIPLRKS